ncbi:MAG: hypothetical protein KJ890_15560 [Gammaproteobacteria bacterium]|nr:hypothetical protein [Gammaproteobacteria bacterium]MBU1803846.1 hypothetical protein [Gammaproteobacteria bacterium]
MNNRESIRAFHGKTFNCTNKLLIIDGDLKRFISPRHMTGFQLMEMLREVDKRRQQLDEVEENVWKIVESEPSAEALWPFTSAEVEMILRHRARAMTGYDVHSRAADKFYIWRMGEQPGHAKLVEEDLFGKDPVEAAKKFLSKYLSREEAGQPNDYLDPVRRVE